MKNPCKKMKATIRKRKKGIHHTVQFEQKGAFKVFLLKVFDRCHALFSRTIPDEIRSLPDVYFYPLGVFIWVVMIGIFLLLFLPQYLSLVNSKQLALNGDSSRCDEVTISNTGTFLGASIITYQ